MTLDLSKLSPAPWNYKPCNLGHPDNARNPIVTGPDCNVCRLFSCEATVAGMISRAPMPLGSPEANAAFIALARNAFDVMMRRGWSPCRSPFASGGWAVDDLMGDSVANHQEWPDPFTALVEADLWYKHHVEGASPLDTPGTSR